MSLPKSDAVRPGDDLRPDAGSGASLGFPEPDLRFGVSRSDRERPLVTAANGTVMARRPC